MLSTFFLFVWLPPALESFSFSFVRAVSFVFSSVELSSFDNFLFLVVSTFSSLLVSSVSILGMDALLAAVADSVPSVLLSGELLCFGVSSCFPVLSLLFSSVTSFGSVISLDSDTDNVLLEVFLFQVIQFRDETLNDCEVFST